MYKLITAPAALAFSVADAKKQLRVESDFTDDDTYIEALIGAATIMAENHTNRQFINATWEKYFDAWPTDNTLTIGKSPVSAITHVKYYDSNNTEQTLVSGTDYFTDLVSEPARIKLVNQPAVYDRPGCIWVRFVASYGAASVNVDKIALMALKMIVSNLYEQRQDLVVGVSIDQIPQGSKQLLDMIRVQYI